MAILKKAAKKAVPKVKEEPKQIVLTQEQYDELVNFKWELSRISYDIKDICTGEDNNPRVVAFELGALQIRVDKIYMDLVKITDDIDPVENVWGNDDDDDETNN